MEVPQMMYADAIDASTQEEADEKFGAIVELIRQQTSQTQVQAEQTARLALEELARFCSLATHDRVMRLFQCLPIPVVSVEEKRRALSARVGRGGQAPVGPVYDRSLLYLWRQELGLVQGPDSYKAVLNLAKHA